MLRIAFRLVALLGLLATGKSGVYDVRSGAPGRNRLRTDADRYLKEQAHA